MNWLIIGSICGSIEDVKAMYECTGTAKFQPTNILVLPAGPLASSLDKVLFRISIVQVERILPSLMCVRSIIVIGFYGG